MPTTATTPFDATRTCPHPDHVGERTLPFNADNFYIRPTGTADYWCRECVRRYNREQRARRAQTGATRGRKFGVEIECLVNRSALIRELQARGLRVYDVGYSHAVRANEWKVVTDASVGGGYELVSPPLKGAAGFRALKLACEALDAAGARVDRRCGLHVHHEVSDLSPAAFARLFRLWSGNQRGTDGLVAPSRRGSQWAYPLAAGEVSRVTDAMDQATTRGWNLQRAAQNVYIDRYRSLNIQAFGRYGTVEVRQHQGTTNYAKIAAWVAFGQAFVAWAKGSADVTTTTDATALVDALAANGALSAAHATTLRGRAAHFSGRRQPVAA